MPDATILISIRLPTVYGNIALLKENYISLVTSDEKIISALKELKDRRNKSHFDSSITSYKPPTEEFIKAVEWLKSEVIPIL